MRKLEVYSINKISNKLEYKVVKSIIHIDGG